MLGHDLRAGEQAQTLKDKWNPTELRAAQRADPTFGAFVDHPGPVYATGPRGVRVGQYQMIDGLLYLIPDGTESRPTTLRAKLCVPEGLRKEVLFATHDDVLGGGHLGRDKTFVKCYTYFYWPTMYLDIQKYVEGCGICDRRKGPNRAIVARLNPIRPKLLNLVE